MSDIDTSKASKGWTDREVLVYLVCAIEASGIKIDFTKAPCPPGRNPNGCAQKMNKLKTQLKSDIDALKAGVPSNGAAAGVTPKKTPSSSSSSSLQKKRKVKDGETDVRTEESTPSKKRGRPKKAVVAEKEEREMKTEGEGEGRGKEEVGGEGEEDA